MNKKPNFSNLGIILSVSNKTAKKYWDIVLLGNDLNNKNKGWILHNKNKGWILHNKNKGWIPHNKTPEAVQLKYIDLAYQKMQEIQEYVGKKVDEPYELVTLVDIIDDIEMHIPKNLKAITPDNPQFIRFNKNAYQLINQNYSVVNHNVGKPIVIGKLGGLVVVLMNNKLYKTKQIKKADINVIYLTKSIVRDKLKKNGIMGLNFESFEFITKDLENNLRKIIEAKIKRQYGDHISKLSKENMKLKEII